jgi:flagella basal body P-ring formation protein FlgA
MRPIIIVAYLLIIVLGLVVVELRNGFVIRSASSDRDFPTFWATVHFIFDPNSMQYVAATNLKKGDELRDTDLAVSPTLREYLRGYLPRKRTETGRILLRDIGAGNPVLPGDLDAKDTDAPKTNSKKVQEH